MRGLHFSTKEADSGSLLSWVLLGLLGAALGWGIAGLTVMKAGGYEAGWWPQAWRYADSNLPMISSADGFYYLHKARQVLDGGVSQVIPPFSRLTASLARLSSQPAEAVAFYMSLIFHLGLGLLAVAWARLLKAGRFCAFLAAMAMALMPAWLERAGPGRFDTDLPILLFWQAGLYFLARVSHGGDEFRGLRPLNLVPAFLSFALLSWFWSSGIALALISLGLWAFLFLPRRVWGFKARFLLGLILLGWLVSLFLLPPEKAPAPAIFLEIIHSRMTLAFGNRAELFYSSIKELTPLSPAELLEKIGGSGYGGVLVLLSGLFALIRYPALRLPLLLAVLALLAGLKSNRVVYLGLFPLALSLAFLPATLANFKIPRLSGRLAGAFACLLIALIGYSDIRWATTRDLDLRWEGGHDRLLEALRQEGKPEARLWNWWDDGYFLAARSGGLTPLFDGGSQTHTLAYIAAHPFMMNDRRAAARWMRFFAIRGEAGMEPLIKVWGPEQAWLKLEEMLAADTPEAALALLPEGAKNLREWIFPTGTVYWFMPGYFFKTSNWWIPLALSPTPDEKLVRPHIEKVGRDKFLYDPAKKSLTITKDLHERGYKRFGAVFNADQMSFTPPWPSGGSPYIIYSDKSAASYIIDEWSLRALPLHMMLRGGLDMPGFRPLAADKEFGWLWEVLP